MEKCSDRYYVRSIAGKLIRKGRLENERCYLQHGSVTVLDHSIRVADLSLMIAEKLRIRVDRKSLITGALLHDYFLYDWHKKGEGRRLHGFRHPFTAARKASEDYQLTDKEKRIIKSHMFPLVPIPPDSAEGWIVCIADKISAFNETFFCRKQKKK